MDIGTLREEITIQSYTKGSSDGRGGYAAGSYSDGNTVWAAVTPLSGSRALQYGEILDKQPYEILIREDLTIDKRSRIKYDTNGDKLLTVHSVQRDPRTFETKIIAYANND